MIIPGGTSPVPATALLLGCVMVLTLLSGCGEDAVQNAPSAGDDPVLLSPEDFSVYCGGEDIVLTVTGIDHSRHKSFLYMLHDVLYRVPFDGADTLRVVIDPDAGNTTNYTFQPGVERYDGTSSLGEYVRCSYLPFNSFGLRADEVSGEYRAYTDTSMTSIMKPDPELIGRVSWQSLPWPGALGGAADAHLLLHAFPGEGRQDTLWMRCEPGRLVQMYDLPGFLLRDLAPDTAGARMTGTWLQRPAPAWRDVARFSSDSVCQYAPGYRWEVLPAGGVLRLRHDDGWSHDFEVTAEGRISFQKYVTDTKSWGTYVSLTFELTSPEAVMRVQYFLGYLPVRGLPAFAGRSISFNDERAVGSLWTDYSEYF